MAAWDVTSYVYSGKSLNASGSFGNLTDVFLSDDGTSLYFTDASASVVAQYDLSTAWDVSTATFAASFSVSTQASIPSACFIGDSGTKLYVTGPSSEAVHEYDLSTAWDVSTASYVDSFNVASQERDPSALYFSDNGTKMFVAGNFSDSINEYTLSTAWDVSTASFVDAFSVAAQTGAPRGIGFGDSGSKVYVCNLSDIFQYDMTTAWDVSTASYVDSLDISSQANGAMGVFFRGNGENFYIGTSTENIYQYSQPVVVTGSATMAGTSAFNIVPANAQVAATMAAASTFSGAGNSTVATNGRAVDEASAGGTNAVLSVSLNSAISEPANPTGNT